MHPQASTCLHQSTSPAASTTLHPGPIAVRSTGTRWRVFSTDFASAGSQGKTQLRYTRPCIFRLRAPSSVCNHVLVAFTHLLTLPLPLRARANFSHEHYLSHRSGSGDHTTEHHSNPVLAPQTQPVRCHLTSRHHRKPGRDREQCYKCSLRCPATAIQWRVA